MSGVFRLICGLMLLVASLFSQYVQAETCQGNTGQMTLNFQNIKYLPTLRVNTQMSSIMPVNGGGIRFTCDRQGTDIVVEKNRLSADEYPGWADH